MKKNIIGLFIIFSVSVYFTACGLDLSETVNYANEQLNNQTTETPITEGGGFDLESAITGALEDEGVSTITDEGTLCFDVPEGYIYDEVSELYISSDSTANIQLVERAKDGKVIFATDEAMELVMEEDFKAEYGYDVDVIVSDTEEITISGYEGACVTFEYTLEGNRIINKQILVTGDKNHHAICFIYYPGSPYADDWDSIKESVRFE